MSAADHRRRGPAEAAQIEHVPAASELRFELVDINDQTGIGVAAGYGILGRRVGASGRGGSGGTGDGLGTAATMPRALGTMP